MVAGVVEHLDRPMAVESAVDSGFLVDTSPGCRSCLPQFATIRWRVALEAWLGTFLGQIQLAKRFMFSCLFFPQLKLIDTWGGE